MAINGDYDLWHKWNLRDAVTEVYIPEERLLRTKSLRFHCLPGTQKVFNEYKFIGCATLSCVTKVSETKSLLLAVAAARGHGWANAKLQVEHRQRDNLELAGAARYAAQLS